MARIVDKGFKVIALSTEEADNLGWGCLGQICMNCNDIIKDEVYYIAVLNDVMDKDCYESWLKRAKHYPEDKTFEDRNFEHYTKELGLC